MWGRGAGSEDWGRGGLGVWLGRLDDGAGTSGRDQERGGPGGAVKRVGCREYGVRARRLGDLWSQDWVVGRLGCTLCIQWLCLPQRGHRSGILRQRGDQRWCSSIHLLAPPRQPHSGRGPGPREWLAGERPVCSRTFCVHVG